VYPTGSDGRLEKLDDRESPIVLCCAATDPEQLARAKERVVGLVKANPQMFFPEVSDCMLLGRDCLYCTKGKYIPMRAMQSLLLYGDEKLYQKYLNEFAAQVLSGEFKSHFKKFDKEFLKVSLHELRKCISGTGAVKPASGTINYESGSYACHGIKYCALRSVQYSLNRVLCERLMTCSNKEELIEFLKKMFQHRQTHDLIDFCREQNLLPYLSEEETTELKNNYSRLLTYQTVLQSLASHDHPVSLRLSTQETKEFTECLTSTLSILQKIRSKGKNPGLSSPEYL
jgi:hypothetical protein